MGSVMQLTKEHRSTLDLFVRKRTPTRTHSHEEGASKVSFGLSTGSSVELRRDDVRTRVVSACVNGGFLRVRVHVRMVHAPESSGFTPKEKTVRKTG